MFHNKVNLLLEHLMCQDIPTVYGKLHFWTFTKSIADSYSKYGRLTIKQINAIAFMIHKYTGVECLHYKIERSSLYASNQPAVELRVARVMTKHNFKRLEPINTYDLPYKEGAVVTAICHPFNRHSIVIEDSGRFFKVPKP